MFISTSFTYRQFMRMSDLLMGLLEKLLAQISNAYTTLVDSSLSTLTTLVPHYSTVRTGGNRE